MEPMTFCVNTSYNERPYIELLLQSLLNGVDINLHHFLIFVDSDNEGTTDMLINQHSLFPNLTIVVNRSPNPIGYQANSNWMFKHINTEKAVYLQSDMVVCLKFDECILNHLNDNTILSCTRVEPPLHCQFDNSVTYVRNFGLTPEEFNYKEFLRFAESIKNSKKFTNYFFAPFSFKKSIWNSINGYDVQFKKSREDSDICCRLCLNKINFVQSWDAIVYHFTCISSRGVDWYKHENKDKEILRQKNDKIELQKFIKKWGRFAHPTCYDEVKDLDKSKIIVNNPPLDFEFEIL